MKQSLLAWSPCQLLVRKSRISKSGSFSNSLQKQTQSKLIKLRSCTTDSKQSCLWKGNRHKVKRKIRAALMILVHNQSCAWKLVSEDLVSGISWQLLLSMSKRVKNLKKIALTKMIALKQRASSANQKDRTQIAQNARISLMCHLACSQSKTACLVISMETPKRKSKPRPRSLQLHLCKRSYLMWRILKQATGMINQDSISVPSSIKFVKLTSIWTISSLDWHASSVSSKLMRSLRKA